MNVFAQICFTTGAFVFDVHTLGDTAGDEAAAPEAPVVPRALLSIIIYYIAMKIQHSEGCHSCTELSQSGIVFEATF